MRLIHALLLLLPGFVQAFVHDQASFGIDSAESLEFLRPSSKPFVDTRAARSLSDVLFGLSSSSEHDFEKSVGYHQFRWRATNPMPSVDCQRSFDVAVLGAPFDLLTSNRPGARFGPRGVRQGSLHLERFNPLMGVIPYESIDVVDCGDSPMTFFSSQTAVARLEINYRSLLNHSVSNIPTLPSGSLAEPLAGDGEFHPRVMMLGGDHTVTLPALRALKEHYGPISVVHFDAHCDTGIPERRLLTHGNFFGVASQEGLLSNNSVHAGIRGYYHDVLDPEAGFIVVEAYEIEDIGYKGVIQKILNRLGDSPVYISIDIDVLDPAFAPATGTPVPGGWTSLQMKKILHGLRHLRIVGADVVEVAPAYDSQSQTTQTVAADLAFDLITMMSLTPLTK